MPVDVSGDITLIKEQEEALKGVLSKNGDTATLQAAAGGTVTREKVTFTCASAYPCTITVTNSLGTIVATWASQTLGDGTASAMASGLEPPVDTFAELNAGSTAAIRTAVVGAAADSSTVGPVFTLTELIGMGIGGSGVLDASKAGLRSDFQANGAALAGHTGDSDQDPATVNVAVPGALPDLRKGTTITVAMRPDGDGISTSDDMKKGESAPPAGWDMKTLHRDWGDTAGDGDGGFETGAIVVENLGAGTPHPFDRKLHDRYINLAAQLMYDLDILANGNAPTVTSLATSVDINNTAQTNNSDSVAATNEQWAAMVFDSDSLVGAQDQDLRVDVDETFTGSYFGAPGQFRCLLASCALARKADGTVGVADTDAATDGIQSTGRWSFTPDPGAMITVPDQDWMAYGAWLTTPDVTAGDHRLGVFFNGMDPYEPITGALDPTNTAGLRGSATYSGGATGVYVDGTESGLFTADAMLTADFDKASNGTDQTTVDNFISGRIDNFRGTDGVFLGTDTEANPNDPIAGGENDWVVLLGAFDFGGTQTGADMAITTTATTGSADGVEWTGSWNGMFFGPGADADGDSIAPSGVAGQFWAETADPDATSAAIGPVTAVVGAFGATKD